MGTWAITTDVGRRFMQALARQPEAVLVALDFDGTLAPIVPDPDDSRLPEGTATALAELLRAIGTVAIVTGRNVCTVRRLAHLDDRPELTGLVVVGAYGAERWVVGAPTPDPAPRPEAIALALPRVAEAVERCSVAGVVIEDKGRALGIHTRRSHAPEAAMSELLPILRVIAGDLGLTVEPGRSVIELRASQVTKGDAIETLIVETGATVVAMGGDDLGDLPAFDILSRLTDQGLIGCRVVSASPEQAIMREHGDIVADGPDGIAAWLRAVADAAAPRTT